VVVLLAGGTGGAKLARGMLDVLGDELTVIANTGDDIEIYGSHVSPDPDLVTFWLADRIDERGWGIKNDTFHVMDGLRELGEDIWFNLGDRDLAVCLRRARRLAEGARLTETIDEQRHALNVKAQVLPMCDDPVRTYVQNEDGWHAFQEFMIREQAKGPVTGVEFRGAENASLTPEVRDALQTADMIVIGPSNPVISIGPILAVGEMRAEMRNARVVAVSPLVRGAVLKGPTDAFMQWAGHPLSSDGIAAHYAGLIDGLVADQQATEIATLVTDVEMGDAAARRRVAETVLGFA
jgi:LPPG:FO 2-phospho-L-lactate transferase